MKLGEKTLLNVSKSKAHSLPTLLIVDDDDTICKMLKTVFSRLQYRVLTAENGKECVDLYKQNASRTTLVILDWKMPIMDGKQAFTEIRKINPAQKILLMSGNFDPDELDRLLDVNSDQIGKPFTIDDIVSKVESILQD